MSIRKIWCGQFKEIRSSALNLKHGSATVHKRVEEQLRQHIDVERLTSLFRELDERFNGYERRVVLAWLQERVRLSPESLAMGLLKTLGIKSQYDYQEEGRKVLTPSRKP
jgi:hypothetical protein